MIPDLVQLARRSLPGPQIEALREGGGKVVGYSCVSTPRELLDAAGLHPFRIRALGSTARELADARMSRFNCSFCRSCLQLGLDGSYHFLDGLIETNGCDHLRGMFENWQHEAPAAFFHYLRVPHLKNEDTLAVFTEELDLLRQALREHFAAPISDDDLRSAIARQARVGERMRRIQALRELPAPTISGTESLALTLLESAWPRPTIEELLDRVLEARRGGAPSRSGARLLLAGSATDELDLVSAVEELGGQVVADTLCYGDRALTALDADAPGDPLAELARAYLDQLLCPRMFDDYPRRLGHVLEVAERADLQGVILIHNKFCDLHGVENVRLRIDLEQRGLPALVLEKEYGASSDLGRILTRVQAFLERIDARDPGRTQAARGQKTASGAGGPARLAKRASWDSRDPRSEPNKTSRRR